MSNSLNNTVLIRADANRQMGIGHAMRCLAVGERLVARGNHVIFAMHEVPHALLSRLGNAGVELLNLSVEQNTALGFADVAQERQAKYAMLDGYHLGNEYEQSCSAAYIRTLRFDDYMPGSCSDADIIVNASPHAQESSYQQWAPKAELLLGPQHIAFRSEMIAAHQARQNKRLGKDNSTAADGNGSILINFGGSDHLDMTIRTVTAIADLLPDANIEAVTGAAYPNPERLSDLGIERLTHHHNSDNLPEVMQRARLAISAGGLTVAELALFRIPTILAITAQNQIKGAHVSWCHTILPDNDNGAINTNHMLDQILLETERLWQMPDERALITSRIPEELDIYGADRIADALIGKQ